MNKGKRCSGALASERLALQVKQARVLLEQGLEQGPVVVLVVVC
jgi:hypothetical protein